MTFRLSLPLLAASLAVFPFFSAKAKAEPNSGVSPPIFHENVAVYFVRGPSAPGPVPQTLQEALAKGSVEVSETGTVQELRIENKGDEPVFVQFGDIVKGGRQDRVLTVSLLLQPKSGPVPISAYCVEQGRWSARGIEDAKKFSVSEALMPSREAKVAMARPAKPRETAAVAIERNTANLPPQASAKSLRTTGDADRIQRRETGSASADGQSEVWRSVGAVQDQLSANLAAPVASETSRTSLQLTLEHGKLKAAQDGYLAAIEPVGLKDEDIVGVVFAVNGRISGADVYPSNGLFRKMWPKLARAAVTEALSAKSTPPAAPAPSADSVKSFLADADAGKPTSRDVGSLAKLDTRDAEKALSTEARTSAGAFVHRNYLAK